MAMFSDVVRSFKELQKRRETFKTLGLLATPKSSKGISVFGMSLDAEGASRLLIGKQHIRNVKIVLKRIVDCGENVSHLSQNFAKQLEHHQ